LRVQFAARRCSVPDSIRERAEELVGALSRFDGRMSSADVVFEEDKRVQKVEVILHIDGASPVVASAEDGEFRVALDRVVDRAARMLRRARSRASDHKAPSVSSRGDLPE